MEKTLVLIKPDAFKRGLVGEIISRFERAGLRLEETKIVNATTEIVGKHYLDDKNWGRSVGKKTVDAYKKYNLNVAEDLGTDDSLNKLTGISFNSVPAITIEQFDKIIA